MAILLILAGLTTLIFFLVILIDPYCLIRGYDEGKRLPFYTWCHYNYLKNFGRVSTGVLGSSSVNYYSVNGLSNPDEVFFMGVESSNIYEHLAYGRLLLEKKPKKIYFFYTFYALNPSRANQREFISRMVSHNNIFIDIYYQYLNFSAIKNTLRYLKAHFSGWGSLHQLFLHNGLRTHAHYVNRKNYSFDQVIGDYFSAMSIDPHYYASKSFQDPKSIIAGIEAIKNFKMSAEAQGCELEFVSTPLYRETISLIFHCGLGNTYKFYREKLSEIAPFHDLNLNIPFVKDKDNWWDSHHCRNGREIFSMLNSKNFLVGKENVDSTFELLKPSTEELISVKNILENYGNWDSMRAKINARNLLNPPLSD